MLRRIAFIYLILITAACIAVGFVFENQFYGYSADHLLELPSRMHWLGTDSLGRDLLLRILFGARTTFLISFVSACGIVATSFLIGTILVYLPRKLEQLSLRVLDILDSVPSVIIVSSIALIADSKIKSLGDYRMVAVITLSFVLTQWVQPARLIRSRLKTIVKEDFVLASTSLGAPWINIVKTHLWPATKELAWIIFLLQLPQAIFLESFLSFMGLGIETPLTSWGVLIHEGWKTLSYAPHLILAPAGALLLTTLSVTYLRDTY